MAQVYSDPKRESDPYALPDVEVFYYTAGQHGMPRNALDEPDPADSGWYWWACFPGCLPDGDPQGPYATEAEATEAAQEGSEVDG
jgi:hypothetical protein